MDEEYESVALVKPEIFVYRIPPLGTNRGHKLVLAADWKLDAPDWTGRMKLVAIGKRLELRLEDKTSGGYIYGLWSDVSALFHHDHFKYIEKSAELEQTSQVAQPSLDLAFKEGQTISINIGVSFSLILS
ncbi:hypothetical protein ANCCEY_01757 [Ancylostoma ceylanicum]|uniref:NECAP PHear domain-containing protein n=1 Tax=Ancylostoma ceylanicum TaxID=53326 RepID=A0A0D6M6J8_9BILA|nr:hypothetical protein ANCCEY_01757 [Ancylostoma ceylanicum]